MQLSPTGNALATSRAIRAKMEELARFFPPGLEYSIPYDTSPFVEVSIEKVLHTLVEAVVLVFLVMLLFLQSFRYTIIPTIVVPVALLGTCAIMLATGFSINVLTMFAMVLAIGILVDDAIVVVENVERIMSEEGLPPREATRKAMGQITGAIIGITLVLTAVFVPMGFFPGAVGVIYQQFSLTMVVSILFSGFLALSLTPALCASFLKPIPAGHHLEKRGFFGWFNRGFARTTRGYTGLVGYVARRAGRFMVIYLALVVGLGWAYLRLPTAFIPNEDQGYLIVDIQAPPEASANRTIDVIKQVEDAFLSDEAVEVSLPFRASASGAGQNKAGSHPHDWSAWPENSARRRRVPMPFWQIRDAITSPCRRHHPGAWRRAASRSASGSWCGYCAHRPGSAVGRRVAKPGADRRVEGFGWTRPRSTIIDREKVNNFGVAFSDINDDRLISVRAWRMTSECGP